MQKRNLSDWAGKVALVTGASSGIGEAVAEKLASVGMQVALCGRRKDRLAALAQRLEDAYGAECLALETDLRQEADILAMFKTIREAWGGVDVLINNAGLGHNQSLLTGQSEAWREMLEVNVLALCITTREAVKDMRARGDKGHVLHIGSMAGHRVPAIGGVYSATKFAVRALCEGLRQELRSLESNIRVGLISPGIVETEFFEKYHQSAEKAAQTTSQFKVLEASDIAQAVFYSLEQPAHMQVGDILIRPTAQPS